MIKGLRQSCIIFICLIMALCTVYATEIPIIPNGITKTDVKTEGNVTNIQTTTAINGGTVGVNTFSKFNVPNGHTVNLNLINSQTKLINLIYDSSASHINGVVNSYMNGKIGGNVLFANPNGFVIGADGAFNVGSLTLMTPSQSFMDSFVSNAFTEDSPLNADQLNKLISFSFNGDNYLVCSGSTEPIKLATSTIEVSGTINADSGIDLISGGKVDIKTGAQLNANVEFQYDSDNSYTFTYGEGEDVTTKQLSIVKSTALKSSITPSAPSTFAMNDGNGVVIVAANDDSESLLGAIVNLNGNINAKGSNVVVRTGATSAATSTIDMNATLSANELTLSAVYGEISSTGADFTADSLNLLAGNSITLINEGNINISSVLSEDNNITLTSKQGSISTATDYTLNAHGITMQAENGSITLGTVVSDSFEVVKAGSADIKNLNVDDINIITTGKTKLGTVDANFLNLTAGSAEIANLTTKNRAKFDVNDTLKLENASVGFIDADAKSISVTTSLTTTKTEDVSYLRTSAGDLTVETLTTAGDVSLTTTTGNISVGTLSSTGNATLSSAKNIDVTTKLDIDGNANISAKGNINATNGVIEIATLEKLSAKSTDIKTLTITKSNDKTISITDEFKVGTATFDSVKISASSLDVTTSIETTAGSANITTANNMTIESLNTKTDAVVSSTSGNINITTLKSEQNSTLTANNGSITLGTVESNNNFTSTSKSLDINTAMTVGGAVNMTADSIDIDPTVSFTDLTINTDTLEFDNLTVTGTANITATDSFTVDTASIKDLILNTADINVTTELGVTGKANITATGDIDATNATIEIGTLEKLSANNADIKTLTITSTNDKTINITNALTIGTATFDSVKISAASTAITNLTTTVGDATLSSTGATTVGTGNIKGALNITKSSSFTSDTKLTVAGDTTIKSSGAVELAETDMQKLTIESVSAKATGLNSGDTKITTTEKTELLNTSNVSSLDLNADSADIATLNSGDTKITTTGKTKLGTAKVDVLEMTVGSTEIESLTSGVTKITADENVKLGTAMVGSIILSSGSADITTLHSLVGDANITAKTGDITLAETTVKGALTASAKNNLTIKGTTSVEGKTTLKAENTLSFVPDSVTFSDLLIEEGTGTVDIKNLTITENAVINSNNNVILTNADVTGDITVNAKDMTVSGKLDVKKDAEGKKGNATINATGDVSLNQTSVANDLKIVNADNLTLNGTTDVGGKTQLKATDTLTFVPENVTFKDLTILEGTGTVDIKNLTITENAVIYSNKNVTLANADVTGNITVNANDMTVSESLVVKEGAGENTGNAIINATGDVILNKTTVANDLKIVNTKNLTIKDATDVGGKTKLKATGILTFEPDNVSFKDLEILEGTGTVNINNLTITENAVIYSNTYVAIANADVTGDIVVNAKDMTVSETFVVNKDAEGNKGNATINATGDVILNKTKVANDLNIVNTKNLTIKDTTEVEGKTKLKATERLLFEPENVTFKDLTILEGTGTVDINHLTIIGSDGQAGQATINSDGKTTIKQADVTGNLTTNTWQMEVDELNVSDGKTLLRSKDLITIHNAQLDDLTTYANNMKIDDMTVEGPINTNNIGNLEVTNMLTAHDEVNMRSDASINIKNAVLDKDLYLNSKDATVKEMILVGNLNGNVDKLKVNTENTEELKIGYIAGKSKRYAISTKITTPNTVVNGLGEEYSTKDINIYGKNITIDATTQIASPDKQLNFKLAKNNNIRLYSDGTIDVFTTGNIGNYRDIVTDNLNIKTDSDGINIYRAIVTTYGDIRLDGKHIIIDNTTWAPDLYVTLQLRSITSPHFLFVNGSPFIRTQSLNALRHGMNIYVNKTKDATSMNSWLTSSMEAQLKTSNLAEKFYDKTDKNLNIWSTLDTYIADNFAEKAQPSIVRTVKGDVITNENAKELINSNPNAVKKRRRLFKRKQSMEISCK